MAKKRKSPPAPASGQLLYTRRQVAALIGSSVATVKRLEDSARLMPIKLTDDNGGMTYYRRAEVLKLAQADAAE